MPIIKPLSERSLEAQWSLEAHWSSSQAEAVARSPLHFKLFARVYSLLDALSVFTLPKRASWTQPHLTRSLAYDQPRSACCRYQLLPTTLQHPGSLFMTSS